MSNVSIGLISSAVTVYGVYKLGKTAYDLNNTPHQVPTKKNHFQFPKKGELDHEDDMKESEDLFFSHNKRDYHRNHHVNYSYFKETTISDKLIFVPKHYTQRAYAEDYILERFESNKQLFYYLRRRSNMDAIHGDLRIFQFEQHPEILIFCTNLHNFSGVKLYVIGSKNDKEYCSHKSSNFGKKTIEKWKMTEYFMTAGEIERKYGIFKHDLPSGSSSKLPTRNEIPFQRLISIKNKVSIRDYTELKAIKTKLTHKSRGYPITKEALHEAIQNANIFRQIISFSEDKNQYYIDMVLLVDIGNNNWIGIVFRDYGGEQNYIPIELAIDCYDIRNKMILCHPPKNDDEYNQISMINNNISGLNIIDEQIETNGNVTDQQRIIELQNQIISMQNKFNAKLVAMQNSMKEKDAQIEELKEQNNHYFQQCLNPLSTIKPHSAHEEASKAPSIPIFCYNNNYYHIQQPQITKK